MITKVLVIGDVHGRDSWEKPCELLIEKVDHIVFLGDYVDTREGISPAEQKYNLQNIIAFANKYSNKVHLLLGNHDLHYMFDRLDFRGSGYEPYARWDYLELYRTYEFKMCVEINDIIFVHAGITSEWYDEWAWKIIEKATDFNMPVENMSDILNVGLKLYPLSYTWVGSLRGGLDPTGGPTWADYKELVSSPIVNRTQVVGHTQVDEVHIVDSFHNSKLVFCDTGLEEFPVLEITSDKVFELTDYTDHL